MKVYVVWSPGGEYGFAGCINEVFSTYEKAEWYCFKKHGGNWGAYVDIEEKVIDNIEE